MASDMIDLGLGVDLFAEEEEDPEILADPLNQLDLKVCSPPTPPSPSSQIAQPKCQKMNTAGHSGTPVEQMCSATATSMHHLLGVVAPRNDTGPASPCCRHI